MSLEEMISQVISLEGGRFLLHARHYTYDNTITFFATIERESDGDQVKIERQSSLSAHEAFRLAFEQFDKVISRGYTKAELQPTLLAAPKLVDDIPF